MCPDDDKPGDKPAKPGDKPVDKPGDNPPQKDDKQTKPGDNPPKPGDKPKNENVTGDIEVPEKPDSAEGASKPNGKAMATVKVRWKLKAPCPPEKIRVKQEVKGYIEFVLVDGSASTKMSAHKMVEHATSGIPVDDPKYPEVNKFRSGGGADQIADEFGPDISAEGSSTYTGSLIEKSANADGGTDITLKDDPGSDAVVSAVYWKEIHVRLTFRTTVYCGEKEIGKFIWHVSYDLPGGTPDVGLGPIK